MTRSIGRNVAAVWLALLTVGAPGGVLMAEPPTSMPERSDRTDAPTVEEARALQQAGQWNEAAEAWRHNTGKNPDDGTAWFNLGYCLHAAGRLEEAIEAHGKAAGFDEYHGIALYNLGCAYALTDRPDAAIEALTGAQTAGFRLRGRVEGDDDLESLRGDPRLAALLDREPAGVGGVWQRAVAGVRQFVQQRAPGAGRQVSGLLQHVTQVAYGVLARLQERISGDERFAVIAQMLQQWLGRGADDGAPHTTAAAAWLDEARRHQQAGEWDEAVVAYEAVIAENPDDAGSCFGLAYCLHMSGNYEKAIDAHRTAATFEQFTGISLYNLACAFALTGRTDQALEALEDARAAGFDLAAPMRSDSDLDSLRADPRFAELLGDLDP